MPEVSEFTNSLGVRRLSSLFLECQAPSGPEAAVYTLKEYDYTYRGKLYKSLMKLYLEECDPTEYNFANKYLCDYTHWEMICEAPWFKEHLDRWRKELQLKLRAAALAGMIADASEAGREGQAARKFLLDGNWAKNPDFKPTKGRPSKQDIKNAAHDIANESATVKEHYARLIQPTVPVSTKVISE